MLCIIISTTLYSAAVSHEWQRNLYTKKYTNHVNDLSRAVIRTKLTWDFYNRLRRLNDASCIALSTYYISTLIFTPLFLVTILAKQHRLERRCYAMRCICYVIGSYGYVSVWSDQKHACGLSRSPVYTDNKTCEFSGNNKQILPLPYRNYVID